MYEGYDIRGMQAKIEQLEIEIEKLNNTIDQLKSFGNSYYYNNEFYELKSYIDTSCGEKVNHSEFFNTIENIHYQNGLDMYYVFHKDNYTDYFDSFEEFNARLSSCFSNLGLEISITENYNSYRIMEKGSRDQDFSFESMLDMIIRVSKMEHHYGSKFAYHVNLDKLISFIKQRIFDKHLNI